VGEAPTCAANYKTPNFDDLALLCGMVAKSSGDYQTEGLENSTHYQVAVGSFIETALIGERTGSEETISNHTP
jgi:hypothetical protein